jgi:hypothetical protein
MEWVHFAISHSGANRAIAFTKRRNGRCRRNLAVHEGVDEGRVAAPLRTFITVIPALQPTPRQAV